MIYAALIIASQASALVEPAKGPLYELALPPELEALRVAALADDLQVQPVERPPYPPCNPFCMTGYPSSSR